MKVITVTRRMMCAVVFVVAGFLGRPPDTIELPSPGRVHKVQQPG